MVALLVVPLLPQVSSISGSDTSDSFDSDSDDDELTEGQQPAGSSSRRSAKGQKSSSAVVQGAQVVFTAQGALAHSVRQFDSAALLL